MAGLAGPPGQTATSDAGGADRGGRGKANHRGERLRERMTVVAVYIHLVWVNLAWGGLRLSYFTPPCDISVKQQR